MIHIIKEGDKEFVIAPSGAKIPKEDWPRYQEACKIISHLILGGDIHTGDQSGPVDPYLDDFTDDSLDIHFEKNTQR